MIKGGVKIPRNIFSMKPTILVEAKEFTGYFVEVKRELDKKERYGKPAIAVYMHVYMYLHNSNMHEYS